MSSACKNCGADLLFGTVYCGVCGHPVTRKASFLRPTLLALSIVGGTLALLGGGCALLIFLGDKQITTERSAESARQTKQNEDQARERQRELNLPASERIALAKSYLKGYREDRERGLKLLQSINKSETEYREAQKLFTDETKKISERLARETLLGQKPWQSKFDGKVFCVDRYLKLTLNDYDSSEYLEWSEVQVTEIKREPYWTVTLRLRAKNSFGGKILKDVTFLIRNDRVVTAIGL